MTAILLTSILFLTFETRRKGWGGGGGGVEMGNIKSPKSPLAVRSAPDSHCKILILPCRHSVLPSIVSASHRQVRRFRSSNCLIYSLFHAQSYFLFLSFF